MRKRIEGGLQGKMSEGNKSLKRKTLSALIWKFSERVMAQLVGFVVSVVLARILLPEEYGIVAIVAIFISLADVLVTHGLGSTLIQKKESDALDFDTILYSGLILSGILYILLFFAAPLIAVIYKNEQLIPVLRVMGLRIPIAAVNSVQHAYVSKGLEFRKFFFSTLGGTLVSGVVGIVMAYRGFGVWALVAQYMTNTCIDTLVLFFTVGWRPGWQFSYDRFKSLFSFGKNMMISGFVGVLFNQLSGLIVGAKYNAEDLAYYNKGEKYPALVTSNIEQSIDSVLFPVLSQKQDDNEAVKSAMRQFIKHASYIIMPLMAGLAASGETFVKVLLTDKWLPCVPFIQIFCVQQAFSVLNTSNLQVIKAKGEGKTLVRLETIKKPILLAILMISPTWMAIGVAAYELIAAFINSKPTTRMIGYSFLLQMKDIAPNLVMSIMMGVVVLLLGRIHAGNIVVLLIQVLSGIAVYIGLSFATGNESFKFLLEQGKKFLKRNASGVEET